MKNNLQKLVSFALPIFCVIVLFFLFDSCQPQAANVDPVVVVETIETEPDEPEEPASFGAAQPRSNKWPAVQRNHLKLYPVCEACGTKLALNVHHVKPFRTYPELELDPKNLITLCRDHHFTIGHDPDGTGPEKPSWTKENPNVRRDAKIERKKLK